MANRLLGITGLAQSGKSTITTHLIQKYDCEIVTASEVIKNVLAEETGRDVFSRDELRAMGERLKDTHGPDFIIRYAAERDSPLVVVDGLRNYTAYRSLLRSGGTAIAVIAQPEVRFHRGLERALEDKTYKAPHISLEDLLNEEAHELNSLDRNGMHIIRILREMEPANIIDTTELSRECTRRAVDTILAHNGYTFAAQPANPPMI